MNDFMHLVYGLLLAAIAAGGLGIVAAKYFIRIRNRRAEKIAARNHAAHVEQHRHVLRTILPQARISKIGTLTVTIPDPLKPQIIIDGWGMVLVPGCQVHALSPYFGMMFCGYTSKELIEIHARKEEFEQPELS